MAGVDRISELPEPILHHILSFLSHKQAIQTSALSRSWRHVGPTRPKIELRELWFQKSSKERFLSVLGNTLQIYNRRNLSVHEFILEMSSDRNWFIDDVLDKGIPTLLTNMSVKKFDFSVPRYSLDPSFVFKAEFLTELYLSRCKFMTTNDNHRAGKPLFKGLKRLSLNLVSIADETFAQIMRSCPLIEYLCVSDCPGLTIIPETIFQAESLTELHLTGCKLTGTSGLFLIKRLKTLSLDHVCIAKDALEEIMCRCPLIERVILYACVELLYDANNNLINYGIGMTICLNWYGHDKYFFPRLKSLYLNRVKLSAELFESFSSSNFPSLEDLQLIECYGYSEIQLTLSSIKRLVITTEKNERMAININAPNIHCFELSVRALPELIFYTETGREWKSHVVILPYNKVLRLPWLLQLRELLNSLRDSQISLDVTSNPFKEIKVENTDDVVFCKPVPLERVFVKGDIYQSSFFPDLLVCLLLICRPRYIGMDLYTTNSDTDSKKGKKKLAELIIFEIIRNQGEMSRGYSWGRDLEEINMQVWDENSNGWHNVRVEGTLIFPRFTSSDTKIRFPLKWKGIDRDN